MDSDRGVDPDLAEVRRHHLDQVNGVLRRPGMYAKDESAEHLLLEAMAVVDGRLAQWRTERHRLRERDAFASTGVVGAFRNILPPDALRDATASVYAEVAHHYGWLVLDRALSEAEFQHLDASIDAWVAQDRTLSELVEAFGRPSLRIGGGSRLYPMTLAYTTADHSDRLICFHLWNGFATFDTRLRGVYPEPVLLAVRHRRGSFPDSFSFTPEGLRRKPTVEQLGPDRPTIWIFHGDSARYASAVFDTMDAGLAWAAEHGVTGILAEYPFGATYDVALGEGRFTPSKPHHGTADHVAAFSPGKSHTHLTNGHPTL